MNSAIATLRAAFGIHPGRVLFRIGGTRQQHIGARCHGITMMALIDHEGAGRNARRIETIRIEQPQRINATREHRREVLAPLPRQEAKFQSANLTTELMQQVEAVPIGLQHAGLSRQAPSACQHRRTISARKRTAPQDQHRLLRGLQRRRKRMRAIQQCRKRRRPFAQMLSPIGQIQPSRPN